MEQGSDFEGMDLSVSSRQSFSDHQFHAPKVTPLCYKVPEPLNLAESENDHPTGQKKLESTLFPCNFNPKEQCDDVESSWETDWICKKSLT